jgi:hypothetical protein
MDKLAAGLLFSDPFDNMLDLAAVDAHVLLKQRMNNTHEQERLHHESYCIIHNLDSTVT